MLVCLRMAFAILAAFVFLAVQAAAQIQDGDEFTVAPTEPLHQYFPHVIGFPDGGYAISWDAGASNVSDRSMQGVHVQQFAAGGSSVDGLRRATTTTNTYQTQNSLALLSRGGYVLVWRDGSAIAPDTFDGAIRAQRHLADGTISGSDFLVNSTVEGDQSQPDVAGTADGGFVIAWTDASQSAGDTSETAIRAQRFDSEGTKAGGEILVNSTVSGEQTEARVTALAGGGFAIIWRDLGAANPDLPAGVHRLQIFGANGEPDSAEILVNTDTIPSIGRTDIEQLADGSLIVAWSDYTATAGDPYFQSVRYQRYSVFGDPIGDDRLVNTHIAGDQQDPAIAALPDSEFIIAYYTDGNFAGDNQAGSTVAQRFFVDGERNGEEFRVNTTTQGKQGDPDITSLPDGRYLAVYMDASEFLDLRVGRLIKGQRYLPPGAAPTVTLTSPAGSFFTGQFTLTATFSEPVSGLDIADFVVENGTASDFQTVESHIYTIVVTADDQGHVTVSLPRGAAQNGDGVETARATSFSSYHDNRPPTVTSISGGWAPAALEGAGAAVWFVQFSEPMINLIPENFVVSGTTASVVEVNADGNRRFFVVAGGGDIAALDGLVELSLTPNHTVSDSAGNRPDSFRSFGQDQRQITLRNKPPTVDLYAGNDPAVSGPFNLAVTFSEDVTGFDASDLSVSNGAIGDFSVASGSVYRMIVTPTAQGLVTVDIPAGVAVDSDGNNNLEADQLYVVNGIAPHNELAVAAAGVGSGTLSSNPSGIDCGADCSEAFPQGLSITLTATPDAGSSFASWTSGPCAGSATATCEVTMNADTSVSARFTLDTPPAGRIVAATLPGARSGYVGGDAMTVFMSVVSRQSSPAQGCRITAPGSPPFTLSYRRVDGSNQAIGEADPLFDLGNGGTQSFVIALTPTQVTGASGYLFQPAISCDNAALAPIEGVNSVLVSIGNTAVSDILSIGATPTADGVIRIPSSGNRISFMSAAAVNIGAGDGSAGANEATVTVSVDSGAASLPLTLEVCETPSTGGCSTPRGQASLTTVFSRNTAKFFAVFARISEGQSIPFDPANARVFLRFTDASGVLRSVTSAAVTSPAPAGDIAETTLEGRWSILVRQDAGDWPSLQRGSLHVLGDGRAVLASGNTARLLNIGQTIDMGNGLARFVLDGATGVMPDVSAIRLGDALSDQPGAFWGVRDTRSVRSEDIGDHAGSFGALTLAADGTIRGTMEGCIASGTIGETLSLMSCTQAGSYTAILDRPANDNFAPALIIANESQGWRVSR